MRLEEEYYERVDNAGSDEDISDFDIEDPENAFIDLYDDDSELVLVPDAKKQRTYRGPAIHLKRVKTLNRYSRATLIKYFRLHSLKFHIGMSKARML